MIGSFEIPDSCTSSADCDFLVTYQKVGGNVTFELSGKAGWAGVGFSDDRNMVSSTWLLVIEGLKYDFKNFKTSQVGTNPAFHGLFTLLMIHTAYYMVIQFCTMLLLYVLILLSKMLKRY